MPAKWHKYSYSAQRQERRTALVAMLFVALFASVFFVAHSFLFTMYIVRSDTMEPGLSDGDFIISTPLYHTKSTGGTGVPLLANASRADLVVVDPSISPDLGLFRNALNTIVSFATLQRVRPFGNPRSLVSRPVIRRIVGLPGDTIYLDKSILHVRTPDSSHFLTEFEIVTQDYDLQIDTLPEGWTDALPFSDSAGEITLGEDEYFVLCDNRLNESDSRVWGSIPGSRIRAKVFFRYWPLSAIGTVD